jgi:c-di-GMP-binding flagellar brake protein YcgR
MLLPVLVVVIASSFFLIFLLSVTDQNKKGWVQFYAKGKDSGFSFKEIELLQRLAVKSKLEDPMTLFFSNKQLDTCIRNLVRSLRFSGTENEKANQDFLSKLYDFRKKIEMEKPKIKHGISNSRQISDGQNLRVLAKGYGVYKSQVVKNTTSYLTISRPVNNKLPATFSWMGMKLSVYFWRSEDAGYVFDTEVLDEVFSKGIASIKISHSDSLFRTQKRKSIRVRKHKAAYLYPVLNEDELNKIEDNPGIKCFIEDLSDTGCAVTIGGKAQPGLRIKTQFFLNTSLICMAGTVRSVDYKEDLNRSLLHVEADPLPIEIRNQILGEVFGMLPEEEDELPFRLLGEEAEGMAQEIGPEADLEAELEAELNAESGGGEELLAAESDVSGA